MMRISLHLRLAALGTVALCAMPLVAAAQTFTDIPADSPIAPAAEYLRAKGIIQSSATFNPNGKLTRAQVAKILVATLMSADELAKITSSTFSDVPAGEWYVSYVEAARKLGIVDTAPTFNPNGAVTKAGFLKMLFKSKKIDYVSAFSDFTKPLSSDVKASTDWYYPVIRYALSSSVTAVTKEGLLSPARELTRGDMAVLYYRLDMYKANRRTQALLSQVETDIGNVLQMLDAKSVEQAEWASNRAIITARGALAAKPDEPIVKGAVKVSEGFQFLMLGYKAGIAGKLDDVIANSKEAYASAEKAKTFSPGLSTIAAQMQTIAKNMADEARALKAQPAPAQ